MLITDASKCKPFESLHRVWQGIPGIAHTKGGRTFVSFYSGDTKETVGYCATGVARCGYKHVNLFVVAVLYKVTKKSCHKTATDIFECEGGAVEQFE